MKIDCLLIQPPVTYLNLNFLHIKHNTPRGLLSIASFLEKNNISVKILPLDYHLGNSFYNLGGLSRDIIIEFMREILKDNIKKYDPDIVGVGVEYTFQYPTCLKILKFCKELNPNIKTIIGGPHVTFWKEKCFQDSPHLDAIVIGEGEWTLLDFINGVKEDKSLKNVEGILYRESGKIHENKLRALGNLDELPVLNYELLPNLSIKESYVHILLSRGCPYSCNYCVERKFWGNKVRLMKIEKIIEELKILNEDYNVTSIGLEDSLFDMRSKYFLDFLKKIAKENFDLMFYLLSRADTLTDNGLKLAKKANIHSVFIGIESASSKVLKLMNKQITFKQAVRACKKIRNRKMNVGTFWIVGHPGDNPKEALISLKSMEHLLKNDLTQYCEISIFVPYPGTPFFENPEKYGVKILTCSWENYGRFNTKPVYELNDFSNQEIFDYWLKAQNIYRKYSNKKKEEE